MPPAKRMVADVVPVSLLSGVYSVFCGQCSTGATRDPFQLTISDVDAMLLLLRVTLLDLDGGNHRKHSTISASVPLRAAHEAALVGARPRKPLYASPTQPR